MQAVTYIDETKSLCTYHFKGIKMYDFSDKLGKRLRDTRITTEKLIKKVNSKTSSSQVTFTQPATVPMQAYNL